MVSPRQTLAPIVKQCSLPRLNYFALVHQTEPAQSVENTGESKKKLTLKSHTRIELRISVHCHVENVRNYSKNLRQHARS